MEAGRESRIRVEVAAHSHVESKAPAQASSLSIQLDWRGLLWWLIRCVESG